MRYLINLKFHQFLNTIDEKKMHFIIKNDALDWGVGLNKPLYTIFMIHQNAIWIFFHVL